MEEPYLASIKNSEWMVPLKDLNRLCVLRHRSDSSTIKDSGLSQGEYTGGKKASLARVIQMCTSVPRNRTELLTQFSFLW